MSFYRSLAAAVALAVLCTTNANAGHGAGGDPYVFTNWDGDHLWSNPENWNQPEPPGPDPPGPGHVAWVNFTPDEAVIDYAAPSIGELVIGQGGGDGAVRMTTGGSITTSHVNLAWGADRTGILEVDGGVLNVNGQLRMGREAGLAAIVNISGGELNTTGPVQLSSRVDGVANTPASAESTLTVSGGVLRAGPIHANGTHGTQNIEIAHLGGDASMEVTSGAVWANNVFVANLVTSTATGSLTVTGGELHALQIGVGASSGSAVGHFTIGGDTVVRTVNHIFLRPDGRGNFTVEGSQADIQLNRVGSTGFEVTNGSVVTFNADAGGFSAVNIPQSTMRFSGPDGILNVDATLLGVGTYDLFTFQSYFSGDHTTLTNRWGTENLAFAPGLTGSVLYNPNNIQLQVIPEPGSLWLLAAAGMTLVLRRRRV